MYPYIRESRRILAKKTVVEQDVSLRLRDDRGADRRSPGSLAAYCLDRGTEPHAVHEDQSLREEFQSVLTRRGVQLRWPGDPRWC